jgi:hypothetical protein
MMDAGLDASGWCGGQPVGETQKRPFQLSFNSWLRVDFQGASGNTVDQNRLKPCWGRPLGLHTELESESKTEIPVKLKGKSLRLS